MYGTIVSVFFSLICIASGSNFIVKHEMNNETYVCYRAEDAPLEEDNIVLNDEYDYCICKEHYCECCECEITKICVRIEYYPVFKIPAAFGLIVTYKDEIVLNVVLNATNLPCIAMPLIKDFMKLCLQLYNLVDHGDHVSVCMKLKGKVVFTKFHVFLGCVNLPKNNISCCQAVAVGDIRQLERYHYNINETIHCNSSVSGSRTIMEYNVILVILGFIVSYKQHIFSY